MRIQILRHATLIIEYAGYRLLLDPCWRDVLDAINHCRLTRTQLREHLKEIHVYEQVVIPKDGEWG